jgi:hypothetical protein
MSERDDRGPEDHDAPRASRDDQKESLFSVPDRSRRIFSRCLTMMITAIRAAKMWK